MGMLLVNHDTFSNLSDYLTKLVSKEPMPWEVKKIFSCGRTKPAALFNCIAASMKYD